VAFGKVAIPKVGVDSKLTNALSLNALLESQEKIYGGRVVPRLASAAMDKITKRQVPTHSGVIHCSVAGTFPCAALELGLAP
jgi:hypothetical protein